MYVPKEIVDFLESILGIYLSDIRHKERSAFILVDNLIEISCKTRIVERGGEDKRRVYYETLSDAKIPLKLRQKLIRRHKIRNDMQHIKLCITVDNQDCACAAMDLIRVIKKLWGKYSLDNVPDWVSCALRITELYSNSSNHYLIKMFEKKMLNEVNWNIEKANYLLQEAKRKVHKNTPRFPNSNEIIIEVGARNYWALLVREKTELVNQCLDEILL
ncbi:MAG: hypothetical protein WB779_14855 [Ignavibacteriaceae bacterium]